MPSGMTLPGRGGEADSSCNWEFFAVFLETLICMLPAMEMTPQELSSGKPGLLRRRMGIRETIWWICGRRGAPQARKKMVNPGRQDEM